MSHWQVQQAKARFSELVRDAQRGPQTVTVRGRPAAVVLSKRTFDRMVKPKASLVEFLNASPLAGVTLKIERDRSLPREVDV